MKLFLLLHGFQGQDVDLEHFRKEFEKEGYIVLLKSYRRSTIQLWSADVLRDVKNFFQELENGQEPKGATLKVAERQSTEQCGQQQDDQEQQEQEEILEGSSTSNTINTADVNSSTGNSGPLHIEFSLLGHSLGGIIGRFLMPDLLEYWSQHTDAYTITLKQFITLGTPHLGIRRCGGTWMKTLWKNAVSWFAWSNLGGCVPAQLHLDAEDLDPSTIQNSDAPPILLLQMCYGKYIDALSKFQSRLLIALPHHDLSVPYPSASLRRFNPYPINEQIETEGFRLLANIVAEEFKDEHPEIDDESNEWISDNYSHLLFHRDALHRLQSLPWNRIDIQFYYSSMTRFTHPFHVMMVGKLPPYTLFPKEKHLKVMDECIKTLCNIILQRNEESQGNIIKEQIL